MNASARVRRASVGKQRFQLKIVLSHRHVFCGPEEGASLGIGYRHLGTKTRMMGGYRVEKEV